jgi:putative membrane protein
MSLRLESACRGLILIGLALFLTHLIVSGKLLFYINPRFAWLTWVAAILLTLVAYAYQRARPHEPLQGGLEHESHHHSGENPWIALALVALPLLLGILVPPKPLGAQAVSVREVNTDGLGLEGDEQILTRDQAGRNILDWLRAFSAADDPGTFSGQNARVVGFVFRDESYGVDQFMVSRFVLSCCVADATVLGLIVSWPDSSSLSNDAWVEVEGTFQTGQFDGKSTPILVADRVTHTDAPRQPYLYP